VKFFSILGGNDLRTVVMTIRVNKSRRMKWTGLVARMGEMGYMHRLLVGTSEENTPLGRPRRKWKDNIKRDVNEVGREGVDYIHVAHDRNNWRAVFHAGMNNRISC
jgi:hypothetical protein